MTHGYGLLRMAYAKPSLNVWEPWGGNVPMIIEVHDEAEDIDYLKRSGGGQ